MKRTIFLLLVAVAALSVTAQSDNHYLVFTFNDVYEIDGYKHGTADHLWIVPYDSCRNGSFETAMRPLFVDSSQLEFMKDSVTSIQSFGQFPVIKYSKSDYAAWILYKNRKVIQIRTLSYSFPKSNDVLTVYCVPIIAECSEHPFGYYRAPVVTIDDRLEIWSEFWDICDSESAMAFLHHDFSEFNFVFSLSDDWRKNHPDVTQ